MSQIKGGYYIKARCIQESEIQHAPPHVREVWDWFMMKANHAPYKKHGNNFDRGQLLCTYADIQEALHWTIGWRKKAYSKGDCETAMKWLKKRVMVTTRKTTKGMIVTICNYCFYQNPKNYETYKEAGNEPTELLQTDDSIYKKKKNEEKKKKEPFLLDSIEYQLSELLITEILKRNTEHKQPNLQTWSKEVDKMIRLDNRNPEKIRAVVVWCQKDTFWQGNILSTKKLREKYDQLLIKMNGSGKGGYKTRSDRNAEAKEEFLNEGRTEIDITPK